MNNFQKALNKAVKKNIKLYPEYENGSFYKRRKLLRKAFKLRAGYDSDKEMDCLVCEVGKERACADCCRDWDSEDSICFGCEYLVGGVCQADDICIEGSLNTYDGED